MNVEERRKIVEGNSILKASEKTRPGLNWYYNFSSWKHDMLIWKSHLEK